MANPSPPSESSESAELPVPRRRPSFSRRGFLNRTAAVGAGAALAGVGLDLLPRLGRAAGATEIGPVTGAARADAARAVRIAAAYFQREIPLPAHPDNGDEPRYNDRWASYSKALQHGADGTVVTSE